MREKAAISIRIALLGAGTLRRELLREDSRL
jgi:hypothetical protein